jgi:hypothetical protein
VDAVELPAVTVGVEVVDGGTAAAALPDVAGPLGDVD